MNKLKKLIKQKIKDVESNTGMLPAFVVFLFIIGIGYAGFITFGVLFGTITCGINELCDFSTIILIYFMVLFLLPILTYTLRN